MGTPRHGWSKLSTWPGIGPQVESSMFPLTRIPEFGVTIFLTHSHVAPHGYPSGFWCLPFCAGAKVLLSSLRSKTVRRLLDAHGICNGRVGGGEGGGRGGGWEGGGGRKAVGWIGGRVLVRDPWKMGAWDMVAF